MNSSASAPKRRGRPPKNPKKAEETPLKDKTLRANELDNDDVIVLGSQANSPTSSVCSIASSTVRRSTRKTRLSLEHGSTIDASEDAGPVKSILARSNSDRKYNLRTVKKAGKEESSDEASKSEVASQEAETTKTRKTTIAKSKAVKSSVSGAHSETTSNSASASGGATASSLFSISENESVTDEKPVKSRARTKDTK